MGLCNRKENQDTLNKFGENADIDSLSTPETIWSHGGPFNFLNSGIPMDIVSTSVEDSFSGTGAIKVTIEYYLTDNTKNTIEVSLNGTTRVELADDIKMVTRMFISESGSANTNIGEVNIVDRATGLIVYQSIEIGEGQTLSCVQICPKNKIGIIKRHYVLYARVLNRNAAQLRLRLRRVDGSVLTKFNVTISSDSPVSDIFYKVGGIEFTEGEVVFWECVDVSADNTPIEAGFDIEFESL